MKIGIDTFSFQVLLEAGRYDVFQILDWIESKGLQGLQININGPQGRFLGGDPSNKGHVRKVAQALEQKRFFAEIGGRSTHPDMLRWQLLLCADLGADTLRTCVVYEESLENTLEKNRRNLEKSIPLAESLGVRIALENHEDIKASELLLLLEQLDHPCFGACLDSGNDLALYGDPVDSAETLAWRAFTTHMKDQKLIRVGQTIYSVGIPFGKGDVDLEVVLKVIREKSSLDRILIQDTWGYATPLNPFQREDLQPTRDYSDLPSFSHRTEAEENGYFLNWKELQLEILQDLASQKHRAIERDLEMVKDWTNS